MYAGGDNDSSQSDNINIVASMSDNINIVASMSVNTMNSYYLFYDTEADVRVY